MATDDAGRINRAAIYYGQELQFKGHDGPGYNRGMYTGLTRRGNPQLPEMSTAHDHGRAIEYKPVHGGYPDYDRLEALPNSETGVDVWETPSSTVADVLFGKEPPSNPVPGTEWTDDELIREIWELPKDASTDGITIEQPMVVQWMGDEVIGVPRDPIMQALGKPDTFKLSPQRAAGFNYGSGWSGPLPEVYFDGVKVATALRQIAHDAQSRSWRAETAIRNVRLAETADERRYAVATLRDFIFTVKGDREVDIRILVNELADTIDEKAPPNPKGYVPHMGLHYAMKPLRDIVERIRKLFTESDG